MSDTDQKDQPRGQREFMRLLMQNEPALRAFARSLLPNWQLVDEVIQEASITAWEKFDQLEDEPGFLPWAKVIVRFKCLSAIGKLGRDKHVFSEEVIELLAVEAEAIDADEQARKLEALRCCLDRFSEPHQKLLLAPYAGDGLVKSLAEKSGKSANAFYKLLGRLREKLSDCIHQSLASEARSS